jgi:hypothetical protein
MAPGVDAAARLARLTDHVGYAADALALAQPVGFTRHLTWLAGFLAAHGTAPPALVAELEALVAAAPAVVPGAADALRRLITGAIADLAGATA